MTTWAAITYPLKSQLMLHHIGIHTKYKFDQTDRKVFESTLETALGSEEFSGFASTSDLDKHADFIVSAISIAVDKAIPKSKSVQTESNPISEETLAPIQKEKHRLRRQYSQVIIFSRSILPRKTEPNLKLYGETLKVYPQVKFVGITFDS